MVAQPPNAAAMPTTIAPAIAQSHTRETEADRAERVTTFSTGLVATSRGLRPLAEDEHRAADLDPIAALERLTAVDRLAIHQHLASARGVDEEILALAPDDRMMSQHGVVTEQAHVAFLG